MAEGKTTVVSVVGFEMLLVTGTGVELVERWVDGARSPCV